jgi:hypothetical protein
MRHAVSTRSTLPTRSLSLSGGGLLGAYHLGVVSALQSRHLLPDYSRRPDDPASNVALLGASAGSLVAASVFAGSRGDHLMGVLCSLAAEAEAQSLGPLTPGFSLIDALEPYLRAELAAVDPHTLAGRLAGGRLRVFLTTPGLRWLVQPVQSSRVIDDFQDAEHLVAACILSSYIPGGTGPLRPGPDSAAHRAATKLAASWGIKQTHVCGSLQPVGRSSVESAALIDGGLAAMWPVRDAATVVVSPIAVSTAHCTICPSRAGRWTAPGGCGVKVELSSANLARLRQMISATEAELQRAFVDGHDDAARTVTECGGLW